MVLPVSLARISAISSRRRRTISAALKNSRAFSAGGVSAHTGNACVGRGDRDLGFLRAAVGGMGDTVAGVGLEVIETHGASRHCRRRTTGRWGRSRWLNWAEAGDCVGHEVLPGRGGGGGCAWDQAA